MCNRNDSRRIGFSGENRVNEFSREN
jgi:hypothetical protein